MADVNQLRIAGKDSSDGLQLLTRADAQNGFSIWLQK
jgi:hypothetical protein